MNDLKIWLERLSSLHKSQMRQAANSGNMQVVHLEILQYLSISNRYSNTAQALSEYLGQTKGSISQSLKVLELKGYVVRKPCSNDKRVTRLYISDKAKSSLLRMSSYLMPNLDETTSDTELIKSLLRKWQVKNKHKGFGQCQSCRFNRRLDSGKFECGLTNEPLSNIEIKNICREHEFDVLNID